MRIAYHGAYLVWFELGRTEWMRGRGLSYRELEDERSLFFPVRNLGARYRAPARYDEELTVETRLAEVSGAAVRFEYRVCRDRDGAELATGFTEHAAVGDDGRPRRLPRDVRDDLCGAPA